MGDPGYSASLIVLFDTGLQGVKFKVELMAVTEQQAAWESSPSPTCK